MGDMVRIIDGPLENFSGHVDEVDREKNKVRVTISMFGRKRPSSSAGSGRAARLSRLGWLNAAAYVIVRRF